MQILTNCLVLLKKTIKILQVQTAEAAVVDANEATVEVDGELQRRQQLLPVHNQDYFQGASRQAHCIISG